MFTIPYGRFRYNQDFMIIQNSKRTIVEIKGYYHNRTEEKSKAARQFIKNTGLADEYLLLQCKDLKKLGILEKLSSVYVWKQIRKIYNGSNIKFTHHKHTEIAKIGRSRFYKNIKNQVYSQKTLQRFGL